ncbi:MAG: hypothetical protein ACOYYS_08375 [Chloroflexota bacterium]
MNGQVIAFAAIALVVAAFVVMVILAVASGRKQAEQSQQAAETLGFTPLEPPPAAIAERLLPLHQKGYHKILEIRDLHRQNHPGCTLYLYDVWDVSDAGHDRDAAAVIALVAPDLDLPHFLLFPKVDVVGWAGSMANQFIEKLIGLHARVIDFDERPNFSQRYLVSGDDEVAVRRCLNGPVLAALTQTPLKNLIVSGWGDALMVMMENTGTAQEDASASVSARRAIALTLYERMRAHPPN